eukprot:13076666-Ditylum_brightwellii.AAC.1
MEQLVDVSSQDLLNKPDLPQSKAADWIISIDLLQVNSCTFSNIGEHYTLAVFYFAMNGHHILSNPHREKPSKDDELKHRMEGKGGEAAYTAANTKF